MVNDYDLILISETWLNDSISTAEFSFSNRVIFRRDRDRDVTNKTQGNGVLIAVKSGLSATEEKIFDPDEEALCIKLKLKRNQFLYVIVVYFVPNSASDLYELFFEIIESYSFTRE